MPSRRRPKTPRIDNDDPVKRFAAAVRESEERDRAACERKQRERNEAEHAAQLAAARAAALEHAHRELELAIEASRQARRRGRGTADADAAWKLAKSRVIELETGTPPAWAPPADEPAGDGSRSSPPARC